MFLQGFHRKLTALALCKSIESAIQWFQIHHIITFATIQNPAVYLSGARVRIFSTLVLRLSVTSMFQGLLNIEDSTQSISRTIQLFLVKLSQNVANK